MISGMGTGKETGKGIGRDGTGPECRDCAGVTTERRRARRFSRAERSEDWIGADLKGELMSFTAYYADHASGHRPFP